MTSTHFFFPDVNVAFQQAAHKVLLDDDNLLPLLHLTIDYQGKDTKGTCYHQQLLDSKQLLYIL